MTVRKGRDGKRRRRWVGWQVKYGWKSFLQKRSLSLVARSGAVVERLDKVGVSQVPDKKSIRVARQAHASRIDKEWLHLVRPSSSGEGEGED